MYSGKAPDISELVLSAPSIFLTIPQEIWHTLIAGRNGWEIRELTVSKAADEIYRGTGRDSYSCCATSTVHRMDRFLSCVADLTGSSDRFDRHHRCYAKVAIQPVAGFVAKSELRELRMICSAKLRRHKAASFQA